MYKPTKADLAKLKDSKPVPVIAHSHEVIVPVVYSGLVNSFLEKKGIHLPLTHHQLALMKHDAGVSGYAKGTHNVQVAKQSQKVVVNIHQRKAKGKKAKKGKTTKAFANAIPAAPHNATQSLFDSLRPNNYELIRPNVRSTYSQPTPLPNYRQEIEEALKREKETLSHIQTKINETHSRILDQLQQRAKVVEDEKEPLHVDPAGVPLRVTDGSFQLDARQQYLLQLGEAEVRRRENVAEANRRRNQPGRSPSPAAASERLPRDVERVLSPMRERLPPVVEGVLSPVRLRRRAPLED
jgi:chorismate mutase